MQLGSDYKAEPFKISGEESIMDKWILSRVAYAVDRCNSDMETYNFTQFTTTVYDFWLYDLCDIYLESVKPVIASGSDEARKVAKATLYHCVETGLRLISPAMPFLSEELWQHLPHLKTHPPSIIVHDYPESSQYCFINERIEADVAFAMSVIRTVRSLRSDYELTNKTKTDLYVSVSDEKDYRCLTSLISLIETLASSNKVEVLLQSNITAESIPSGCAHVTISSRCSVDIGLQVNFRGRLLLSCLLCLFFKGIINVERELAKLSGKKEKNEAFVAKLLEQESRPDYEEKVPLPVRIANTEKVSSLSVAFM
ncbi:unnamed protein product [Strongylus vulgaris]|uniref:valine--tRNA ligase n=1 Tax=Strongylus vulgaris TaxID=40348 RepID=A0A3P7IIG8_STRVU|nr:unnamed protein product [Strongylus vulgaris]